MKENASVDTVRPIKWSVSRSCLLNWELQAVCGAVFG